MATAKERYQKRIATITETFEQLSALTALLKREEIDEEDYEMLLIVLDMQTRKNQEDIVKIRKELVVMGKRFDEKVSKENIVSFNKKFTT